MARQGAGGAYEISTRFTAMVGWGAVARVDDYVFAGAAERYALDHAMAATLRKNNPEAFKNVHNPARGPWDSTIALRKHARERLAPGKASRRANPGPLEAPRGERARYVGRRLRDVGEAQAALRRRRRRRRGSLLRLSPLTEPYWSAFHGLTTCPTPPSLQADPTQDPKRPSRSHVQLQQPSRSTPPGASQN